MAAFLCDRELRLNELLLFHRPNLKPPQLQLAVGSANFLAVWNQIREVKLISASARVPGPIIFSHENSRWKIISQEVWVWIFFTVAVLRNSHQKLHPSTARGTPRTKYGVKFDSGNNYVTHSVHESMRFCRNTREDGKVDNILASSMEAASCVLERLPTRQKMSSGCIRLHFATSVGRDFYLKHQQIINGRDLCRL